MSILQHSTSASYVALLALPAPKIAGLLPARVGPPPKPAAEFTYHNATLAELSAEHCEQFIDAVTTLLDVAVAYANGDINDNALRAAQVLFHRQLTGHSPDRSGRHAAGGHAGRPLHPTAYRAERDADLLEWWAGVRKPHPPSPSPLRREGESYAGGAPLSRGTGEGLGVRVL